MCNSHTWGAEAGGLQVWVLPEQLCEAFSKKVYEGWGRQLSVKTLGSLSSVTYTQKKLNELIQTANWVAFSSIYPFVSFLYQRNTKKVLINGKKKM